MLFTGTTLVGKTGTIVAPAALTDSYICTRCGAPNRKLWRSLTDFVLHCTLCASIEANVKFWDIVTRDGLLKVLHIGDLFVPAIPGTTSTGYYEIPFPADALEQWMSLPISGV